MRTVWAGAILAIAAAITAVWLLVAQVGDSFWDESAPLALALGAALLTLFLVIRTAATVSQLAVPSRGSLPSLSGPPRTPMGTEEDKFLGLADSVSAEAQSLFDSLKSIRTALTADIDQRSQQTAKAIRDADEYVNRNAAEIRSYLTEARATLNGDGALSKWYSRDLTEMENAWERAFGAWPKSDDTGDPPDLLEVGKRCDIAEDYLDEVIFRAARITVPSALTEWADAKRPGDTLNFDERFKEELPAQKQRRKILAWLAESAATPGIVDVEHGTILIASPDPKRRLATWVFILNAILWGAAFAAATPLIVGAMGGTDSSVAESSVAQALGLYAALLLGGFAHVAIDAIKGARAGKGAALRGVEDSALWVHVHERQILWGVAILWLTWFLFMYFDATPQPWVAFIVGYSADSFFDTFIGKFATGIDTSLASVRKQYAAPGG